MKMEDHKYFVVILLATYNGERYLKDQIESLLGQKGVKIQILASDDGSTDGTIDILEEYRNIGKLEWIHGPHNGVQKNFLELMQKAPVAEYYAFCDQDDVWDDNKLITAIEKMQQFDPNKPALYFSSLKLVDKDLNHISTHIVNLKRSDSARFIFTGVAGCTMVYNRTLLNVCNLASPEYIIMHDMWVFDVCLATGGKFYADVDSYINYRQHENNVVGIKKTKLRDTYKNYVIDTHVARHMKSLLENYDGMIINEYKDLCEDLEACNTSLTSRIRLFFSRNIEFGNLGLNMIFKIKVALRKM